MFSPMQGVIDWLAARLDEIIAALNPVNAMIAMAQYFASFLPTPDPRLLAIVNDAVAALDTVVRFISLFDYIINLPVLLTVIGIILLAETSIGVFRAWRIIRSTLT